MLFEEITLINCTPHLVTVLLEDGTALDIPPSGTVARREEVREELGTYLVNKHAIPISRKYYGVHESLPPETKGVYYIVSVITTQQSVRTDLLSPDLPVRDSNGKTIGCRGLAFVGKAP